MLDNKNYQVASGLDGLQGRKEGKKERIKGGRDKERERKKEGRRGGEEKEEGKGDRKQKKTNGAPG